MAAKDLAIMRTAPMAQNHPADSLTKHIYLTFDDGPLNGTANCISICESEKVAASFFEVGLHESRSKQGKLLYEQIRSNEALFALSNHCLLYTSPSPRDRTRSRMPSSA